jgi:CO/xanthine dehydrogenase FAD-binding subunit
MTTRDIKYITPLSLEEVIRLKKRYGVHARIIGGGTAIFEMLNKGLLEDVNLLIDLSNLKLDYIKRTESYLKIGTYVTMSQLEEYLKSTELNGLQILHDCLAVIRPLQIKNVATIGGAICSAIPFLDLPPALYALEANLKIVGGRSARHLPITRLYKGPFSTALKTGEILKEIEIKIPVIRAASAFKKFALTATDYALVNCGSYIEIDNEYRLVNVRVAVGGMVISPIRLTHLEDMLKGRYLDSILNSNDVKDAIANSTNEIEWNTGFRASVYYIREVGAKIIYDCLRSAYSRLQ